MSASVRPSAWAAAMMSFARSMRSCASVGMATSPEQESTSGIPSRAPMSSTSSRSRDAELSSGAAPPAQERSRTRMPASITDGSDESSETGTLAKGPTAWTTQAIASSARRHLVVDLVHVDVQPVGAARDLPRRDPAHVASCPAPRAPCRRGRGARRPSRASRGPGGSRCVSMIRSGTGSSRSPSARGHLHRRAAVRHARPCARPRASRRASSGCSRR